MHQPSDSVGELSQRESSVTVQQAPTMQRNRAEKSGGGGLASDRDCSSFSVESTGRKTVA